MTSFSEIKPIPKYIEKQIISKAKHDAAHFGYSRFYAYLAVWHKELVKVTVAVKYHRKKWYCKQVAVHHIHRDYCYIKDINYYYIGGYVAGWYEQGISKVPKWYESTNWYACEDKYFDPYAPIINLEVIDKFPEYKYSAYRLYKGERIFKYLRLYEQYPQLEYIMKLGLDKFAFSTMILRKCAKDKAFCKWLARNRQELADNYFYVSVIMRAYKTGKPLKLLQCYEKAKKSLQSEDSFKQFKPDFKGETERLIDYIAAQQTSTNSYFDYYRACLYLGLDMTEPKNRYPHDFRRWHDIRTDEYKTAVAIANEEKKKALYADFASVAEKYSALQHDKRGAFICVIAKSPEDLIEEGKYLHHCVGSINYDQRFIKEQSLIFFIRTREHPDIPFVTVEYSLASHRVLQCYTDHDHKPDDSVLHYVNKVWLPYANKTIKKIA
ncbi:MAG: PcfJ domain-containing protein [Clostridia bacterium]|nr:PcfJ domain-containing protein [Clostridia bacterium]